MKRRSIYRCAMALLLLCLGGCSTKAHPPLRKGPALNLSLELPVNKAWWVEDTVQRIGRYGFQGEELRLEGVTRFVYQIRSVHRTRTGETRIAITPRFYTIDDWFVTPQGDRSRPPEITALFGTIEAIIRKHPFTITLAPNGTLIDTDGLVELEDALAGIIGRQDIQFSQLSPVEQAAWRRVFMSHIDERPIRRHLSRSFGFLPDGLVRLGDRWIEKPANRPWPFLPTEESVRLINRTDDHYLLETKTEFKASRNSDWPTYHGYRSGTIYLNAETRLGVKQQESFYWKRKRKKTPWEQFTLKSLEGSRTLRITERPVSESPHLYAIDRFPFLE